MPIIGTISSSRAKGIQPIAVNGAGYIYGTRKDGSGTYSSDAIQKLNFVTEARTTISATTQSNVGAAAGFGNATTAGYVAGGINYPSVYNTTQKNTYSSETMSNLGATFSAARFNNKGLTNSAGTAGYHAGGQDLSVFYYIVSKLAYSGETYSNLSATLTQYRAGSGTAFNASVAGYFCGGYTGSTTLSSIDKLNFSGETVSVLGTSNTFSGDNEGGLSNTGYAAYFVGGNQTGISKMPFSTEVSSSSGATMPYQNTFSAYLSCPGNYGAIAGARVVYPAVTDAIQKMNFSTDTRTALSATLQTAGETSTYGTSNATLGA